MSECSAVREQMALLITESLDATRREHAHQHIEGCEVCGGEWGAWRDTWALMAELPEIQTAPSCETQMIGEPWGTDRVDQHGEAVDIGVVWRGIRSDGQVETMWNQRQRA